MSTSSKGTYQGIPWSVEMFTPLSKVTVEDEIAAAAEGMELPVPQPIRSARRHYATVDGRRIGEELTKSRAIGLCKRHCRVEAIAQERRRSSTRQS